MWSIAPCSNRRWPGKLGSLALLVSVLCSPPPVQALPCDFCCEYDELQVLRQQKLIFCDTMCSNNQVAVCSILLEYVEWEVTNCPDAICALLDPSQAICCGDALCRYQIRDVLMTPSWICSCPECENWILDKIQDQSLFTDCLGEDRISCEEADPQCCPE